MTGVDAITGAPLGGTAHLAQSIADILTTPIGTRPMRRDYGSRLAELIDAPMNPLGRLKLFAATADALRRWEPRLRLTKVAIGGSADGSFTVDLEGQRSDAPAAPVIRLSVPLRQR